MAELCVCGCGRYAAKGSSFNNEKCSLNYNPNDYPYEKDDEDEKSKH
ncbi:hypothetical protein ACTHPJ_24010 [Paenibacillus amylolyticus]